MLAHGRCAVIEQTQTPDELKLVNAERKKNKQVALKVICGVWVS